MFSASLHENSPVKTGRRLSNGVLLINVRLKRKVI